MLSPAPPAPATSERRRYDHVRELFAGASAMIAPFFAMENRWGNSPLDHLAYRVIRARYPELSFEEVHVLVVASRRVYVPGASRSRVF